MISTGFGVFNDSEKPFADADSPRTVAMWKEYEDKIDFPVSDEDDEIKTMLQDVHLYQPGRLHYFRQAHLQKPALCEAWPYLSLDQLAVVAASHN
ncbi:hypothetical protein ACQRIU_006099 [Beauveria bassiana]